MTDCIFQGKGIFNNRVRQMAVIGLSLAAAIGALWLKRHFALFARMVGSGLDVPPGEDLLVANTEALVAAGDLARCAVTPMAVVTSDTLLFSGGQVARSAISERTTWWSDRTACYIAAAVGRREALAIAVARFVPGIRTFVFVSVGAGKLSPGRFLLIDTCAAAAWVPLVMTYGVAIVSLMFGEDSWPLGS